jgi:hypothetical protein
VEFINLADDVDQWLRHLNADAEIRLSINSREYFDYLKGCCILKDDRVLKNHMKNISVNNEKLLNNFVTKRL